MEWVSILGMCMLGLVALLLAAGLVLLFYFAAKFENDPDWHLRDETNDEPKRDTKG